MEHFISNFTPTKKIGNYIYFDDIHRKWTILQGTFKKVINEKEIYLYDDIVSFELLEDGDAKLKGGVGRALVGGFLFGGIGAIVGGSTGHKIKNTCTTLQIKITLNNINHPNVYITFINFETKKDDYLYKTLFATAQEVMSTLQIICEHNKINEEIKKTNTELSNNIDEIKKYKQLLDIGAITQKEFDILKNELLFSKSSFEKTPIPEQAENYNINNDYNESNSKQNNEFVKFWLCMFLGIFGAHKFYERKIGIGFLYLFTLGFLGIGWLIDIVKISDELL